MTTKKSDQESETELIGIIKPAPGVVSPTGWFTCDGKPLSEEDLLMIDRELAGATVNDDGTITTMANHELH